MTDRRLVIHGHFYQPPRENPWTETVPVEPSAAPFHDWNERVTAECYRPNAFARILDDHGALVALVDNYRLHVVQRRADAHVVARGPPAGRVRRDRRAGRDGGGAIAQAYSHPILPLADAARHHDPGALGPRRLRAPVRPAGRGDVAARDRRERRGALRARRGRRGLHDPRSEPSGAGASPRRGRRRMGLGRRWVDRHPAHLSVVSPERRRPGRRRSSSTTAGSRTTSRSGWARCRVQRWWIAPSISLPTRAIAASSASRPTVRRSVITTVGASGRWRTRSRSRRRDAGSRRGDSPSSRWGGRPSGRCRSERARGRARTALVGGRRIAAATPAADQGGTKPGGLRCEPRSIASAITVSRCSSAAAARCCTTRGPPATPMWT